MTVPSSHPPPNGPARLEARAISMVYPGVRALDEVDFDVQAGEVHAIVGENGAGKSTLLRILSGEIDRYEGTLHLDGRPVRFASPREALAAGVAVIPQELLLVRPLTAAENVLLGCEPASTWGLTDRRALETRAHDVLARLDAGSLALRPVADLDTGQRQMVAIARALAHDARLVVMDEPTASLGAADIDRLHAIVRQLTARGVAVVYVSHRLDEVRRLAGRITVLRDGRRVAGVAAATISEPELIRLLVGRDVGRQDLPPVAADAEELLRVETLSVRDPRRPRGFRLRGISLTVHRGEIVGLAGLVGAGRSEFLLALTGALDRPPDGRVVLGGRPYAPASPAAARDRGVVLLPEDRATQGIFAHQTLESNVTVSALERVSRLGIVWRPDEAKQAGDLMRRTGVRATSPRVPVATLSGGNQQKALLARCLFASPNVLLLDEPTRGVDVGAKADLYDLVRSLARQGFGIVLCSSDLAEILTLCHRIVVFRDGEAAAVFPREEATEEKVLAAAAAGRREPRSHAADMQAGDPDSAAPPPGAASPPRDRSAGRGGWWRRASLLGLGVVLGLAIVFSPVRGGRLVFLDLGNLTDILRQVAEKGILAAGMTPVIISGGIDLSVGSVLALAATLTAALLMHGGVGAPVALLLVLAAGAAWGLLNGAVIARWRIQPFIVTLATMSAARGVARYVSGGAAIPMAFGPGSAPESFRALGAPIVPYVPAPAVLFLLSVAAVHVLLSYARAGRYIYAIGDNEAAARLAGIRVGWHKTGAYILCATFAALAGLIHCAQLEQGNPNDGVAYELDAIAAVVIGGTSLSGGVGTAGGTLIGTLIIGVINNSMGLNNIDANLQLILKGAIILGAVWIQTRRRDG